MSKRRLSLYVLLIMIPGFCLAQKSSNKTLTIIYTIDPLVPLPEKSVLFTSLIKTPLDPLTPDESASIAMSTATKSKEKKEQAMMDAQKEKLEEVAKLVLVISGPKYKASDINADLIITFETGDVKMTSANEKQLNDIAWQEDVFSYTCPASLTVKDKVGNVVYEKVLASADEEQKMIKAAMFINPAYRMRFNLSKHNPEKLKKLNDEMLTKKNFLVLNYLLERAHKELINAFEFQNKTADVSVFSVKGKAYEELSSTSDKIFDGIMKFRAFSKKNRIPKEDVDKIMKDAIPVWEKHIAENKELEEKASKGLILNCALATTWTGDYEKAADYFSKVSEAKPSAMEAEAQEAPSSAPMGATVLLSFSESAMNLRNLYESFKLYKSRVKLTQ